jgi:formylmethanofuran dehydrogenase subunit B
MGSTCLGCGCACDDIELQVDGNRIVEARHACPLGVAWFGDGGVPGRVRVAGADAALDIAIEAMVRALEGAARPAVYLAADLSCEAQRAGIALADWLRARLASLTSSTTMTSVLAAQERGRAGATLGEIRNRADVIVFWGVDPSVHYPRYWTRYAPEPSGIHVPDGRRSRTVVAVDVGQARGPADADLRVEVAPDKEVAVLTRLAAAVSSSPPPSEAASGDMVSSDLVALMRSGRYVAIVADGEPDGIVADRDPGRTAALITLAQALNATTRCALSTLRAGGNRSGADACTTSQTGYPAAVDFARGYARYRPYDALVADGRDGADVVLVLGSASSIPLATLRTIRQARCLVVGPRASDGPLGDAPVVVDTGVAGIHEAGTAVRMDDVPLPLGSVLTGPAAAASVIRELGDRVSLALKTP